MMGSGGVGGFFGGRRANAGSDVIFIARGAHLAALRERLGVGARAVAAARTWDDVARETLVVYAEARE